MTRRAPLAALAACLPLLAAAPGTGAARTHGERGPAQAVHPRLLRVAAPSAPSPPPMPPSVPAPGLPGTPLPAAAPAMPGPVTPEVLAYVRADRWAEAQQAATLWLDPVAGKLVTYFRLQAPGAANLAEIADFMARNPDWPNQATLARRREEALTAEPDNAVAAGYCARLTPRTAPALLRCAEARLSQGQAAEAAESARAAWIAGITDPGAETRFLQRWGAVLAPDDQWRRFDRLSASSGADQAAAARQLLRLDAARRQLAEARLALRRDDSRAATLIGALPPALQSDPGLMLEQARRLRRLNQDDAALSLWLTAGTAAQAAAPPDRLTQYWAERQQLARRRLRAGDAAGAYALAAAHGQSDTDSAADAEFLAGWIALRRLNDAARAMPHFQTLARLSKAAITQARAHYWMGRTLAADNDPGGAATEYAAAATWPTTYYGQLAALALGDDAAALNRRILDRRDPAPDSARVVQFLSGEVARAAILLMAWGEPYRARPFLLRLGDMADDPEDHALPARLALAFGLPDTAVAIARRAGRAGMVLADAGFPAAVEPPEGPVEPSVTLGVIRQESSFDAQAGSPVGARGLMQLMPATAAEVARRLGDPPPAAAQIVDPGQNMRLGTTYLAGLVDRFGGSLPLAIAGYNAGPNRVAEWVAANGDPRNATADMVDWIELIPFAETRNYVQRVIENVTVYRAQRGTTLPSVLAPWQS